MLGTVELTDSQRRICNIIDETGRRRVFHMDRTTFTHDQSLRPGYLVSFEPIDRGAVLEARAARLVPYPFAPGHEIDLHQFLEEVANWSTDPRSEDTPRYFYRTEDMRHIESGRKPIVTGRKGTGKTAISEFITTRMDPRLFTRLLSFKNFPFNELYALSDAAYPPPNQFITLWKLIIYSELAQLLRDNQSIDPLVREQLEQVYPHDLRDSLGIKVARWTSAEFKLDYLGKGIGIGGSQATDATPRSWIQRVDALEGFLLANMDDATYLLSFDALDEDYHHLLDSPDARQYTNLLAGLIKAVFDVRSVFRRPRFALLPVVFLRDDIIAQLHDPDRGKWLDHVLKIDWTPAQLRALLAHRLLRSQNPEAGEAPVDDSWALLFSPEPVKDPYYGTSTSIFDFISSRTLLRPRDFVIFARQCAQYLLQSRLPRASPEVISAVEKDCSSVFRTFLEDELDTAVPDIRRIFDVLSFMGSSRFSFNRLSDTYGRHLGSSGDDARDLKKILSILFDFGVLGFAASNRRPIFKYLSKDAAFDFTATLLIHPGLAASLQMTS